MREDNGRIKLSWPQVAWGIAMLVALISAWADLRSQLLLNRQAFDLYVQTNEKDKDDMWQFIRDVQAASRPAKK